eukprot:TRINITY_DN12694_c0_g3_i1.p1 TRINITY_DN12694_c0_g3~~TRINITY_DN12694_c0_g3_i1.p1  ORF type:complete len:700 (+),score=128.52 TRINITY_DN12694_c0_g3_i1:83-2182(+)
MGGGKPSDKSSSKQLSKQFAKSDTNPTQRKHTDPVPPQTTNKNEEVEEPPMRWYEMDEEDFSANAMAELEAKMNSKVTMQAVHSIKPSHSGRGGKSKKKGGNTSSRKHQNQGHEGGAPSREAWTKFFGRRWNPVPVLSKRGALSGRKGDARAALEYDLHDDDQMMSFTETESDICSLPQQTSMRSVSSAPTPPPCKYFAQGRCRKGSTCPFLHGPPQQQFPVSYSSEFPDHPEPGVCTSWFYNGHCNNPICNLKHFMGEYYEEEEEVLVNEDIPVCSQWLQGRCKDESRCGLRHGETTSNEPDHGMNVNATMFSVVSQGAGKVANAVATSIQTLRQKVSDLRMTLSPSHQNILTRTLQMCLGTFSPEHRDTLLGLPQDVVGLTRFRSVLVKRTLKWAYDNNNLTAIESVAQWEESLRKWMRDPDDGPDFSKYFEQHLCNVFMEVARCLLALPTSRVRTDWVQQAVTVSTSPDPIHDMFTKWLWFSTASSDSSVSAETTTGFYKAFCMNGVSWSTSQHCRWPLPFRGRTKLLIYSLKRRKQRCYERVLSSRVLLPEILSFLPPVCPCDVPASELEVATHPYLDALCATLVSYNSGIATEEDKKDRLGELVYPLVVQSLGQDVAPMITGMLLELPPSDLLLEAMNPIRFVSTLREACHALENGDTNDGENEDNEQYEEYYEHEEWEEYPEEEEEETGQDQN